MEKVKKNDIIKATVTGVQKYGAFVNTEDYEGLIHISEISYGYVKNINDFMNVGDSIYAEVLNVDEDNFTDMLKSSLKESANILTAYNYYPYGMIIELSEKEMEYLASFMCYFVRCLFLNLLFGSFSLQ